MWPMLGAMGTFLGGAGQFAGSMYNMFQEKGPDLHSSLRKSKKFQAWQEERTGRHLPFLINYAKKAGIHPLAAMGIQPQPTPIGSAHGSNKGRWLEAAGQGLERMSKVGTSEVEKEQIENMKADTLVKNAQAQRIMADLPQNQKGVAGIIEEQIPMDHPSYARGDQRGQAVQSLEQLYRDDRDLIHAMPAEGAQDYMSESAMANVPYQFKKVWRQLFTPSAKVTDKKAELLRNRLDDMENFMRQNGQIRQDEYLTYDDDEGLPRVKKYKGGAKRLFYQRKKGTKYMSSPLRYGGLRFRRNYK